MVVVVVVVVVGGWGVSGIAYLYNILDVYIPWSRVSMLANVVVIEYSKSPSGRKIADIGWA